MIPGQAIELVCSRQAPDGGAAPSRSSSDFLVSLNGVAQAVSLVELGTPSGSNWTDYELALTLPGTVGQYLYRVQPGPTSVAGDIISPDSFFIDLLSADDGTINASLQNQQGIPGALSASDSALGQIVDNNSYLSGVLTAPAAMLTPFGITNLMAVGLTLEAAVCDDPGDTTYPITITSTGGLNFQFGWNYLQPFPLLSTFSSGTAASHTWYIDCRVIQTGPPKNIITFGRYSFQAVWTRDVRVS